MNFSELAEELEQIVAWFESDNVDLEAAVEKFERGVVLSSELKKRLSSAEQKIKKISS
ncbi:TPA: exodeoxyribonuclease VII small subunit [Candidatus Saccharibacteria bacterium]|nr:exodeoxyribonuclease VII small subunit [Candidatus Saccharibacteria bacterium]HIO87552.1 exodeoxyribonuclease VII small subunit [Candidatus Saccharibacteria bacterium]